MESIFSRLSPSLQNALRYLYEQRTRPILIVGNGPSLASIDYDRYPHNPLIVRINNFFFEDKYYVGNHVDFVLCATHHKQRLLAYYITLQRVIAQRDYIFSDSACIATPYEIESYKSKNPYYPIINLQELLSLVPYVCAMHSGLYIRDFLPSTHPTTGMSALMSMVLLGFTTIYIAGIDFYSGNGADSSYVYQMQSKINMRKQYLENVELYTNNKCRDNECHSLNFDLECLRWCQEKTNNRIYSLCSTSDITNSVIPLASKRGGGDTSYIPEIKAEHTLQDYLYIEKK